MREHEQPAPPGSPRFGSDRRLRRRVEFQRVFDTGFRVHGRFLTLVVAPGPASSARLGIVASRKLGNSVQRNRAKRLIREIFRQNNDPRPGLDVVVIPRRELFDAAYTTLEADFRNAFTRCASRLQRSARA
jgi:ribonuclease P protein component